MSNIVIFIKVIAICAGLCACGNGQKQSGTSTPSEKKEEKNYLIMKVDGKEWVAERDIFGSYHFNENLGPGLINIAGTKGNPPNDQPFNINLYNTKEQGTYEVMIADNSQSKMHDNVAQLAQLTPSNYLCGGAMQGNQMTVKIIRVSKNPQMVEATFSGKMQCVEGNTITITEGKFYYHEENDSF
jgi:hypothetical protein